jgi:hypothetical protein
LSTSCVYCHTQVEQNAVDLEGAESPGFNTAEALRTLLTKKGIITPEVCTDQHRLMQQITGSNRALALKQLCKQTPTWPVQAVQGCADLPLQLFAVCSASPPTAWVRTACRRCVVRLS